MVGQAEVMRVRTSLGERGEKEVSVWVKGGSGDPAVSKGESEKEERISSTFFSK